MKDCLPVDDFVFPLIQSPNTPDRFCRIGDIDGPSVEYHLLKAGTGARMAEEEFEIAAERIYSLERALTVRHWARDREMDEMVLPSFEYRENWQNPHLPERYALERDKFVPVMDDYYALRGWDVQTGWPTPEHLERVGLADVYQPMVEGAARAGRVSRPREPSPSRYCTSRIDRYRRQDRSRGIRPHRRDGSPRRGMGLVPCRGRSSFVDRRSPLVQVMDGTPVSVSARYDNEMGYSTRLQRPPPGWRNGTAGGTSFDRGRYFRLTYS